MKPKPTEGELAILGVLWSRGPSTVRQVHEELTAAQSKVGYTTILKLLQIMAAKGLVNRDESERTHTYRAAASEQQTQRKLVRDLIARAFGGSARKLVMHALDETATSPREREEIRKLLEQKKEDKR